MYSHLNKGVLGLRHILLRYANNCQWPRWMDKSYISLPFFAEVYQEEMAHLACSSVNWGNEAQLCTASKCAVISFFWHSQDKGALRLKVLHGHICLKKGSSSGFTWPLLVCLCLQWAILIPHIVLTMSKQPKNGWLDSDVLNQYIVYRSIHRDITIWIPSVTLHIHLDGDDIHYFCWRKTFPLGQHSGAEVSTATCPGC